MQTNKTLRVVLLTQLLLTQFITPNAQAGVRKTPQAVTIEVKASDTARLKELLENQRIDAHLADGTSLQGKVKAVADGKVTISVERSAGAGALTKGAHSIAIDKLTTIKVTKYKGPRRAILATLMGIGGLALGLAITATEFAGESINSTYGGIMVATTVGGAAAGYAWGRALDKKEVTILIK